MGAASVAVLVVATSVLSSIATLYIREPTVIVMAPDSETGYSEVFSARTLKSIDHEEAEKHFKKARKVINSWQAGNLAMGNELYKLRLVPGPQGKAGPTDEKYKDTKAGTAKASKALVVDDNKDISGIRNLDVSGTVTANTLTVSSGGLTVTAGTNAGSGWGINDKALGAGGADGAINADFTIDNANSNGKWHQLKAHATPGTDYTITFPIASTGIYYFYVTEALAEDLILACDTTASMHTTLHGITAAAGIKAGGDATIGDNTNFLGVGDTITVICNASDKCYAKVFSSTLDSNDIA